MLLAWGRATASALSGQEEPLCKGRTSNDGTELCREEATEQDPKRLMELTAEIIRLLNEKEKRLLQRDRIHWLRIEGRHQSQL